MKRTALLSVLTLVILAFATASAAEGPPPSPSKAQTLCPVSGHPVDKAHYVDYQGQRVYFCCDKCPAKFAADPEKYFEKVAKEGVLLENVQTTCPVSGEKLEDKDTYVDYKGRRLYFCCGKCAKEFGRDPAKYLAKVPGGQSKVEKASASSSAAPAGKTAYVCTMCNVTSDKPGKCSKCGMNLVPKSS